ncbi:hypothetical protein [Leptospira alexanderi]|uniref:hypothetical protein n=1 Tax=Leptospira alexanderi TaxID=100053 RepID=UPI0015908551|nr:hypothetical protein [Leptospira alexanderi]
MNNEIESINIVFKDGTIIVASVGEMKILDSTTIDQIKAAIENSGVEKKIKDSIPSG